MLAGSGGPQGYAVKEVAASASNGFTGSEEHFSSAVTTIKGLKPGNPNWTNQDNFFVIENFGSSGDANATTATATATGGRDTRLFCVLDGHGENGHHVSRRWVDLTPCDLT